MSEDDDIVRHGGVHPRDGAAWFLVARWLPSWSTPSVMCRMSTGDGGDGFKLWGMRDGGAYRLDPLPERLLPHRVGVCVRLPMHVLPALVRAYAHWLTERHATPLP